MSEIWLFTIGSVIFIFLTGATILFMYFRFSEVYRVDQAADPEAPEIVTEGKAEVLTNRDAALV